MVRCPPTEALYPDRDTGAAGRWATRATGGAEPRRAGRVPPGPRLRLVKLPFRRAQPERPPDLLGPFLPPDPPRDRVWLHVALFLATFAAMVYVSAFAPAFGLAYTDRELAYAALGWPERLADGLRYAVPFLLFLTVHEFGHYLTARRLGISASLPYFLPVPLPGSLGTFGAVIRIREPFRRMRDLFDVGAAGPLAGVVVAIAVFAVGALTLPGAAYFAGIPGHEPMQTALAQTGRLPAFDPAALGPQGAAVVFGETPLTALLGSLGPYRVPGDELAHFPLLIAGWLGLFFTALNLLPVGQLDGGHVVYALFGPRVHAIVSRVTVLLMTMSAALGYAVIGGGWIFWTTLALGVSVVAAKLFEGEWHLVVPTVAVVVAGIGAVATFLPGLAARAGYSGWTVWILLILFLIRVDHPFVPPTEPLTPVRRVLGYLCIVLFLMSFSVRPIEFVFGG